MADRAKPAAEPVEKTKIQIVFQGGGAKLCALMAVCDALKEEVAKEKADIEIGRVAGTSAGAIAAAMFASPLPMAIFKERLKQLGPKRLDDLRQIAWLAYGRVWRGQPFYSRLSLEKFFRELFCPDTPLFMRDLRARVKTDIYFTDLYSLAARNVPDDEALPIALQKSCRIPIAFSGYLSDDHHVDGGLALNLPVDELVKDESTLGRLIGISFAPKFATPFNGGIIDYTKHLFSAAIQANVNRSVLMIGTQNVFPIETDIDTFDFDKALTEGLEDKYDDIKIQFGDWLRAWLQSVRPAVPAAPSGPTRFIRPVLNASPLPKSVIYELNSRFTSELFTHAESVASYDVAILDSNNRFTGRYTSRVYNRLRMVKETHVLTYDFQAGRTASTFSDMKFGFMVTDVALNPLKFVGHVQELTKEEDTLRSFRLFLLFDEKLSPTAPNQPFIVEFQYEVDDPFPGLTGAGDVLSLTRQHGDADEMILAVAFPALPELKRARIDDIADLTLADLENLGYPLGPTDKLVQSVKLEPGQFVGQLDLQARPENYLFAGRRVQNVKQGTTFGLAIR